MDPGGIGDRLEAADGVPDPIKKVNLRCWNVTKHEIQFTVSVTILNNVLNYNWTVNTALKLNVICQQDQKQDTYPDANAWVMHSKCVFNCIVTNTQGGDRELYRPF